MTDWFQNLMSGFGRVVQFTDANQRQQERQSQDAMRSGTSVSGFGGVAAALGNVAANLTSTNTEQLRPMTISGRFTNLVPDTAYIVIWPTTHTPPPPATPVTAYLVRLVPGLVWDNTGNNANANGGIGVQVAWGAANYSVNVAAVYWNGTAYDFVPNAPAGPQATAMVAIANSCRGYYQIPAVLANPPAIMTELRDNAPNSGHYFVDLVFTRQVSATSGALQWRPTTNPNVPILNRQALFAPGRRLNASSVGNIYEQWDTGLKVTMLWPALAGAGQNSWVAQAAGAVSVAGDSVTAFDPGDGASGMVLQGGNFVAGLYCDRNDQLTPELVAFPGFTRPVSRLYVDMANNPLHLDYDGNAPAPAPPPALVNRINVPAAVAINPAQPTTLIFSRTIRPIDNPWVPQGGTFPVGGGSLNVLLPTTTVFADGVRATTWTNPAATALTANSDHYLTVTTAGVVNMIVQPAGNPPPTPAAGAVLVSRTTTNATGVTASTLLLPAVMPVLTGTWLESFSINLGNLRPGEMNRVMVAITQPGLRQWQAQVTLNGTAAAAAAIVPTQIEIA